MPITMLSVQDECIDIFCEIAIDSIVNAATQDHRNDANIVSKWLKDKTPFNVARWKNDSNNKLIIADFDGVPAGIGMATSNGRIVLCYVHSRFLRKGVATCILNHLESWLFSLKCDSAWVSSTLTGIAFYRSQGYFFDGPVENHFDLIATPMIKTLAPQL